MRSKSPKLMDKILKFAEGYYLDNGHSPATSTIATELGISRATAYRYLVEMNDRGMVEYDGQDIQTDVTRKLNNEINRTAIVGSVPCGTPEYKEENIEEYVSLPTAIFGKGDFFILRASGQSMIEAGIDDGDLVVVRKQMYADEGDIIVALVDNQNTLKRFYRDEKNKKIILHPENRRMKDIIVDECFIQGVACHIIKACLLIFLGVFGAF
ncbi:MAG: transcriptional repressor LexA [Clostridiales bacterium]|nr:transcriptional repressor LexA [Clostridiales bacterium]